MARTNTKKKNMKVFLKKIHRIEGQSKYNLSNL